MHLIKGIHQTCLNRFARREESTDRALPDVLRLCKEGLTLAGLPIFKPTYVSVFCIWHKFVVKVSSILFVVVSTSCWPKSISFEAATKSKEPIVNLENVSECLLDVISTPDIVGIRH